MKTRGKHMGRPRRYELFFLSIIFCFLYLKKKQQMKQDINLNPGFYKVIIYQKLCYTMMSPIV